MGIESHRQMFVSRGQLELFDALLEDHAKLFARRETSHAAVLDDDDFGSPRRIRDNTLIYRQVLLHRAILLLEGAIGAAQTENAYSMALSIRGHFETTAALGYLHSRLASLKAHTILPANFDMGVTAQMLGSKDKTLSSFMSPKQVLTMLEHADKTASKHLFEGKVKGQQLLKESYEWLCEFCHPNFHSNAVAIDIDKSVPEFRFRHGQPMRNHEFNVLGYLMLSASIFVELFDQIEPMLPNPGQIRI